jgi:unsaturated rhamnogalacturonyl hydrolase
MATRGFADDIWGSWPAADEPATVGKKLVQNLLDRQKLDGVPHGLSYLETCAGFAAVRFTEATADTDLQKKVMARYSGIIAADGTALLPKPAHVDGSVFGILPLEMYKVTKDDQYKALGLKYADAQYDKLNTDGLSLQNLYYLDQAYKLGVLQLMAYSATQKDDYLKHGLAEMSAFIDKSQQADGLFFHGPDGKQKWGRGNGWEAAGLAEMLKMLPADNPGRAKLMTSYKAMMAALLKVQAPDGRWGQVLDDPKAWEENSCTGYFIFAMAQGVNEGWLDSATYAPAVKKAWTGLCGQLDAQANVKDVGVLTEHSNDESYYLARPRQDGNLHGQFAAIWAATALLK